MKFVFLSSDFYKDYISCTEIEQKVDRPYAMAWATINNVDFAIPLRSNIKHGYAVWTNKQNHCGLDLSKAVVINDKAKYIDCVRTAYIRQDEFDSLRGKEHYIQQKLETYINKYIKALSKRDLLENNRLCEYSTLQYFHKELGICAPIIENEMNQQRQYQVKKDITEALNEAVATIDEWID